MSSLVGVAMRRAGEGRLDMPVGLMMGAAAGALMFMMPVSVLEQATVASGLADAFGPAAPPLGLTARAGAAIAAALIGFALAYALMRLVDRASDLFEAEAHVAGDGEPAPRMRRRDLHPDAPIRRPLSAKRDLGHPDAAPAPAAPRRRAPLADEPAMPPMPWEKQGAVPEPEPQQRRRAPLLAELGPEPADVEDRSGVADAALELKCTDVPAPLDFARDEREFEFGRDQQEVGAERTSGKSEHAARPESAEAEAAEPERSRAGGQETIGELLARLERALDRQQTPAPRRHPVPTAPAASEPVDPIDTRLRSALENLKRFAPQRG